MNWKKHLLHGIIAGILVAIAGFIYLNIYQKAFELRYENVMNAEASPVPAFLVLY